MALERKWNAVPPQALTANGNQFGLVTVADVAGFKVKQSAYLKNTAGTILAVQVKRVISPTQLIVGLIDNKLSSWPPLDITSWTVVSGATIGAEEQDKNNIPEIDHYKAIYEADPTVADRVIWVDKYGNFYDQDNPVPIIFDGSINVGNVRITACDDDPLPGDKHSSIRISDCVNDLKINTDGSINVIVQPIPSTNAQIISKYNEIAAVPSGSTVQIITYTVPVLKQAVLQRVFVSGENIGRYDLLINNIIQDRIRTMFGADLSQNFDFTSGNDSGLLLNSGDIVKIQVFNPRPYIGDFNARIQVLEITI